MAFGATDTELAAYFDVAESTLNKWKKEHPEFSESLKQGKSETDIDVAASLHKRAIGSTVKEVKRQYLEENGKRTGEVRVTETEKEVPPDTTACIYWLKNRQPAQWRDKVTVEQTTENPVRQFLEECWNNPLPILPTKEEREGKEEAHPVVAALVAMAHEN